VEVVVLQEHDGVKEVEKPTHPICTNDSPHLSLFLTKEMAKKYLHSWKWGSIPRYPSHNVTKATMC
jgi:hypothetical protein